MPSSHSADKLVCGLAADAEFIQVYTPQHRIFSASRKLAEQGG